MQAGGPICRCCIIRRFRCVTMHAGHERELGVVVILFFLSVASEKSRIHSGGFRKLIMGSTSRESLPAFLLPALPLSLFSLFSLLFLEGGQKPPVRGHFFNALNARVSVLEPLATRIDAPKGQFHVRIKLLLRKLLRNPSNPPHVKWLENVCNGSPIKD
jgi:hypothetical protein